MARGAIEVKAELRTQLAKIQLVRYHFTEPPDSIPRGDGVRIELCLGKRHRTARGCWRYRWAPHRFERIGDLFLVPPDQDLLARSDEDRALSSIVCELDTPTFLELHDKVPEMTERHLLASLDIRDVKIRSLLLRLAEETRHPGFASTLLAGLIVGEVAIELVRLGATITQRQQHGGLASWQLRLIDERLKEMREPPSLEELAALCRISVRQLTRGFRASRGCSVGSYTMSCQTDHAMRLLASGESVTSIASSLGFSSSSNFCFAFRRATGTSPGQFRRTHLLQ